MKSEKRLYTFLSFQIGSMFTGMEVAFHPEQGSGQETQSSQPLWVLEPLGKVRLSKRASVPS